MDVSAFTVDVTPPLGSPLLAGLVPSAARIGDPLEAVGLVFTGSGAPIVICAVDWAGLAGTAYDRWRAALARGAGTTAERVLLHAVHQHNTPLVCPSATALAADCPDLPCLADLTLLDRAIASCEGAVEAAVRRARPLTGVATGQAMVAGIASTRRILGIDGRLSTWRPSHSTDRAHRSLPDGRVDPWLKTVAFYSGATKVAAISVYAVHPISSYGDGTVSSDFAGHARRQRQRDEPGCTHLYLTGCAGDVAAGRYNDGTDRARRALVSRLLDAMERSSTGLLPTPIDRLELASSGVTLTPRAIDEAATLERLHDRDRPRDERIFAAFSLAWLRRANQGHTLPVACLRCNDFALLSLPGECFVEFQLRAQVQDASTDVACAAYGDGSPWYVPTADSFAQGGYEVDRSLVAPDADAALTAAIGALLSGGD